MPDPPRPKERERLERELEKCVRRDDHLDALDIYEELDHRGWINAEHILGMGHCLIKLRRKQDACKAWFRALEIDESYRPVIDALDELFPGWALPPKRSPAQASKPGVSRSTEAKSEAPAAPHPRPAASAPTHEPTPVRREWPSPEPAPSSQRPASSPRPAREREREADVDVPVNWNYVLADVEDAKRLLVGATGKEAEIEEKDKPVNLDALANEQAYTEESEI